MVRLLALVLCSCVAAADGPRYQGRGVADWIADLRTGDAARRRVAALALCRLSSQLDAPPPALLTMAREDASADRRRQAVWALGYHGAPAVPTLAAALADPDREVRDMAALGLTRCGPSAVGARAALLRLLASGDRDIVRNRAAEALGNTVTGDGDHGPTIAALLTAARGRGSAARQAVMSLERIGEPAVPAMLAALKAEPAREDLALVLARVGRGTPAVVAELERGLAAGRWDRARMLSAMDAPAARRVAALLELAGRHKRFVYWELSRLGPAGLDPLLQAARDREASDAARRLALHGLGRIAERLATLDDSAVARIRLGRALIALTADASAPVRASSAGALARVPAVAVEARAALIRLLGDGEPRVRRTAAMTLAALAPRLLGDADGRRATIAALRALRDDEAAASQAALAEAALLAGADVTDRGGTRPEARPLDADAARAAFLRALGDPTHGSWLYQQVGRGLRALGPAQCRAAATALAGRVGAGPKGERTLAINALRELGPHAAPAVPALVAALGDAEVSRAVMWALKAVGPAGAPAVPALRARIAVEPPDETALRALGGIGEPAKAAVPRLVALLTHRYQNYQRQAAYALGGIGEPALPALLAALGRTPVGTETLGLRHWAAEGLASAGAVALPALRAAMTHASAGVRAGAAQALGQSRASGDGERALLARVATTDAVAVVRTAAVEALGRLAYRDAHREAALAALGKALGDRDAFVRAHAGYALVRLRERAAPVLLAELAHADVTRRRRAAWLAGDLGTNAPPELLVALEERRSDADAGMRWRVQRALQRLRR